MREARSMGQGAGRGAFRQRRREKRGRAHGVLSDLTANLVPPSPCPSMRPLLQPPDMSCRCSDIQSCFTSSSSWSTIFQLGPPSSAQSPPHSCRVSSNIHTAQALRSPPPRSQAACSYLQVGIRDHLPSFSVLGSPHNCGLRSSGSESSTTQTQSRHQNSQAPKMVLVE